MFLFPPGGSRRSAPSARRCLQGGGGGAVHPVVLHNKLSGAPGAGPPGGSGEAGVPGWHRHAAHARLVPEAASQTSQTSLRY